MQGEEHAGVAMSQGDESKLRNLVRLGRATSEKRLLSQALSSRSGGSSGGGARAIAAAVNAARSSEEAGEAGRKRRGGIALADGGVASVHPRVLLLQARNAEGESMIAHANDIIEQATKRCFSKARTPYFRITVTDWFGGRGHDFDCMDEGANAHGGMLVIATDVPDAREWIQWKGRTARQDRPGPYPGSRQ